MARALLSQAQLAMIRRIAPVVAATTIAILTAIGCSASHEAPTEAPVGSGDTDLIGGGYAAPQGTGAIYFTSGPSACSGVMIGPNKILTAAHCIATETKVNGRSYFDGTVDKSFRNGALLSIWNNGTVTAPTVTW